jgi:hypothetical protein
MEDGDLSFQRDGEGVTFGPRRPVVGERPEVRHGRNLALDMSQTTLDAISDSITETVAFDEDGSQGWEDMQEEIHDLVGLSPEAESDIEDDEVADTSSHPIMLTALLRFQAKALSMLLPSDDVAIRTEPAMDLDQIEDEAQRKEIEEQVAAAERRVQKFYTDYLFRRLPSYEEDTDMILHNMGLSGVGIRKIVTDRTRKTMPVIPEPVNPGALTISYASRNFRQGRLTHHIDMETGDLIRRIRAGTYRPVKLTDRDTPDIGTLQRAQDRMYGVEEGGFHETSTHRILEVYGNFFFDDDPHAESLPRPYVVTIHSATREILAIERNWDPQDPDEIPLEHFVAYLYHPGRTAINGVGIGQILMQVTRALRKAQRRALEAAYLQNHPSGFKLSNLSIRDSNTKVKAGEFTDVDSPVGDIRAAMMVHPFQGPSQGLLALADKMEQNGRELGGIASIDFASLMKAGIAAGPAMAAFEESTEFQTSVHRRLYKAHRKELELIHDRMRIVMGNRPILFGTDQTLQPGDLQAVNILPYMKPGQASRQKAIMEAQVIWDLARENGDILDRRAAAENFLRAMSSPEALRMMLPDPEEEEILPADPVSEYTSALAGVPIKASPAQNHQAHIEAHTIQMRMVQTSALPVEKGQAVMAVLSAHIAEHMGLQALVEVAGRLGIPLEQMGPNMPPEVEAQIAPMMAQALLDLEKMRTPPDPKLSAEQVKAEAAERRELIKEQATTMRETAKIDAKLAETALRQEHERQMAELKAAHARELQEVKDKAAMDREIEDNTAAIKVARMRQSGKSAGADAGANS